MNLIDTAHVLPLVCFIVDMVFNKIIFPKRHIIGLLILVAMTKGLSAVSTNVLTHSLPGEYNLPVARASYPTYPSNMNLDCSTDWSIIVKVNLTNPENFVYELVNEGRYPANCTELNLLRK